MKLSILQWIVCPSCGSDFQVDECRPTAEVPDEIESGLLVCGMHHRFPIQAGVPRLRLDSYLGPGAEELNCKAQVGRVIADSFDREWQHFDHQKSRTWHDTLDERKSLFLKEVDITVEELHGKLVLDAGCGNGSLSWGISQMGCEVLAADVSNSVVVAHRYYASRPASRVHYIQADLLHPPFRPGTFDVLYSSGVLMCNPDTREALRTIAPALAPGGTIYIWVYHHEPGLKVKMQLLLRRLVRRWPPGLKHAFVLFWSLQSMVRQFMRTLLKINDEKDRLTWRERIIDLLDTYTPRYRWVHTQEEVQEWYRELGLSRIRTTEVRKWGFGVAAVKAAKGST